MQFGMLSVISNPKLKEQATKVIVPLTTEVEAETAVNPIVKLLHGHLNLIVSSISPVIKLADFLGKHRPIINEKGSSPSASNSSVHPASVVISGGRLRRSGEASRNTNSWRFGTSGCRFSSVCLLM